MRPELLSGEQKAALHKFCASTRFHEPARDGELVPKQLVSCNTADSMTPIPGTLQGGFPVRLVSWPPPAPPAAQ